MEKNMKTLLVILTGFLVSVSARAGFMAEPWLGYESGKTDCTNVVGGDCGAKSTGTGYGARLGWMFSGGYWLAGEYMGGSGTIKYDDSSVADDNFEHTTLGATLGFDFPMGFRVFAGYGFSNSLKDKSASAEVTFKGTSSRVGLGYKFHNSLSVNLEYHTDTYTKFDVSSFTDLDISTLFSKFNSTRTMLTLSYVFNSGK